MELSIKEAADYIGKSERTVRHMAQTGRLPAKRIGSRWVISRADLDELGKRRRRRPSADLAPPSPAANDELLEMDAAASVAAEHEDAHAHQHVHEVPTSEESGLRPTFTVSFESERSPAEPGARDYPNSIRELDTFNIATTLLATVAEIRRNPRADEALLAEPEAALLAFIQHLTDGCHQGDARRKVELFQEAQAQACAALSGLVHYNLVYPDPDLSRIAERIEGELLTSLQELRETTARRLTWRGRVITAAEVALERLVKGAQALARGRFAARIEAFDRSAHRALRFAL
ncbi:MAG: helix-turn-helix domain-containing protein [Myxococcales bacterium]|nr:helix-turn-helix domain-containing protein [Myxococcales bacterium]MCB9701958.1 helix-turn-helix domain-containing protein [Myxococcales bacterium]